MKRNELCNLLVSEATKSLEKWKKKNADASPIDVAQQINLARLELHKISTKMEEDYKKGLGRTVYTTHEQD